MNDSESKLSLSVKARIEPIVEGAEQFEQNLQNLPNQITTRVQEVTGSPGFQQSLTPEQIKDVQDWTQYSQGLYQPIQDEIDSMMGEMAVDMSTGKMGKGSKDKYRKYSETQLKALNLVDFTVFPHYDKYRHKPVLDEYRGKYPTEIKALPDDHWYIMEN